MSVELVAYGILLGVGELALLVMLLVNRSEVARLRRLNGKRAKESERVLVMVRGVTETAEKISKQLDALPPLERIVKIEADHQKQVANHNAMALDLKALKPQVETLSRAANAIGVRRIASGVVPPAKDEVSNG